MNPELSEILATVIFIVAVVHTFVIIVHILFLTMVVASSHHAVIFMGVFLFFIGLIAIAKEYQDEIRLRESLLVAFF